MSQTRVATATAAEGIRPADVLVAHRLFRFFRAAGEETVAICDVSLSVQSGELVAVAGPSGSGKSTLLALLSGMDEPDGGSVVVADTMVSHRPEHERARLRANTIGMLFQYGNLLEHLTVEQNLRFARSLAGRRADPDDLARRLHAVGLLGRGTARPAELSGGQAARAALAVALVNDPPLLIADEPTAELDTDSERHILQLLTERSAAGVAIVLASHSPLVIDACHRVVRLDGGRIT